MYENQKYNNLKAIRTARGLTIKEVVAGAGIPMRTYQNYEYCEREMTAGALRKLADFYGVSVDYLLDRNTDDLETIEQLANEFNMTTLEKKILESYLRLPDSMRAELMEFLKNQSNRFKLRGKQL